MVLFLCICDSNFRRQKQSWEWMMVYVWFTVSISVIRMCHTSEPFLSCRVPNLKQKRQQELYIVTWPDSTWPALNFCYNTGAQEEIFAYGLKIGGQSESTSSFNWSWFTYWPAVWPSRCQQSPLYSEWSRKKIVVGMVRPRLIKGTICQNYKKNKKIK